MATQISLGRDFQPGQYDTHRRAILLALAAFPLGLLIGINRGLGFWPGLSLGFNLFSASFVAWILAREWDPDRNSLAFFAQVVVVGAGIFLAPYQLLPSALLIFFARFMTQISGFSNKAWEVVPTTLGILIFTVLLENPFIGLALGVLFLIDWRLPDQFIWSKWLAILSLAVSVFYSFVAQGIQLPTEIGNLEVVILVVVTLTGIQVSSGHDLESKTDTGEKEVDRNRFSWSLIIPLALIAATVLLIPNGSQYFLVATLVFASRLMPTAILKSDFV